MMNLTCIGDDGVERSVCPGCLSHRTTAHHVCDPDRINQQMESWADIAAKFGESDTQEPRKEA